MPRAALAAALLAWAAHAGPAIAASDRESRPAFEDNTGTDGDRHDPPASGERWELIGAFEHYNELIEGEVWHDVDRNEFRFELEGTRTRLKCIGAGEIDASVVQNNQCREIEGDFSLHCGVQRELFGSFEYSSCGYGFAAGLDTLTGSTVAMHFALTPERFEARETVLETRAESQPILLEAENYLVSGGLDPDIYTLGTGFAITADGIILTAAHVVDDEYGIEIHVGDRVVKAEIIAIDPDVDLALLRTDLRFDPLPLSNMQAAENSLGVVAIGYRIVPESEPVQTDEVAIALKIPGEPFYAFEGDIIPGYSGGPLLTFPESKVVGVLHAISVHYTMSGWNNYRIYKIAYAVDYEAMIDFLNRSLDAEAMQEIVSRSHGPGVKHIKQGSDSIVLVTVY